MLYITILNILFSLSTFDLALLIVVIKFFFTIKDNLSGFRATINLFDN